MIYAINLRSYEKLSTLHSNLPVHMGDHCVADDRSYGKVVVSAICRQCNMSSVQYVVSAICRQCNMSSVQYDDDDDEEEE